MTQDHPIMDPFSETFMDVLFCVNEYGKISLVIDGSLRSFLMI